MSGHNPFNDTPDDKTPTKPSDPLLRTRAARRNLNLSIPRQNSSFEHSRSDSQLNATTLDTPYFNRNFNEVLAEFGQATAYGPLDDSLLVDTTTFPKPFSQPQLTFAPSREDKTVSHINHTRQTAIPTKLDTPKHPTAQISQSNSELAPSQPVSVSPPTVDNWASQPTPANYTFRRYQDLLRAEAAQQSDIENSTANESHLEPRTSDFCDDRISNISANHCPPNLALKDSTTDISAIPSPERQPKIKPPSLRKKLLSRKDKTSVSTPNLRSKRTSSKESLSSNTGARPKKPVNSKILKYKTISMVKNFFNKKPNNHTKSFTPSEGDIHEARKTSVSNSVIQNPRIQGVGETNENWNSQGRQAQSEAFTNQTADRQEALWDIQLKSPHDTGATPKSNPFHISRKDLDAWAIEYTNNTRKAADKSAANNNSNQLKSHGLPQIPPNPSQELDGKIRNAVTDERVPIKPNTNKFLSAAEQPQTTTEKSTQPQGDQQSSHKVPVEATSDINSVVENLYLGPPEHHCEALNVNYKIPNMNNRLIGEKWGKLLREAVSVINKPNEERSSFLRFIAEADKVYNRFRIEFVNDRELESQFIQLLMSKFEGPTADSVAMAMPETYACFKRAMIKAGNWVRHRSIIENEARTTKQAKTETALGYIARLEVLKSEYTAALNMEQYVNNQQRLETISSFEKAVVEHAIRSLSDRLLRHVFSRDAAITTLTLLRKAVEDELEHNVDDTEDLCSTPKAKTFVSLPEARQTNEGALVMTSLNEILKTMATMSQQLAERTAKPPTAKHVYFSEDQLIPTDTPIQPTVPEYRQPQNNRQQHTAQGYQHRAAFDSNTNFQPHNGFERYYWGQAAAQPQYQYANNQSGYQPQWQQNEPFHLSQDYRNNGNDFNNNRRYNSPGRNGPPRNWSKNNYNQSYRQKNNRYNGWGNNGRTNQQMNQGSASMNQPQATAVPQYIPPAPKN